MTPARGPFAILAVVSAALLWSLAPALGASEAPRRYAQKLATHHALDAPGVPAAVLAGARPESWGHEERGPVKDLRVLAREESGAVWLGGASGAARFDPASTHRWDRWQYFAGRRWLPDDQVENIWVDPSPQGAIRMVWIRTRTGASLLQWRSMTLEEKARGFEERIEARHVRHGLVADSLLEVPGDLSTNRKLSNDNDGLWTAIYLGAEAYRFAVTGDPEARERARRSLEALLRLEAITGVPGLPARSFIERGERQPPDGEWHDAADGTRRWKGDTSSDECVGHYYAYATYFDLLADDAEKERIRAVVRRMTDSIIEQDYELIDVDGEPTRWGRWSERYFATEEGEYESPLACLEILSFLKTARHIAGDSRYERAYEDRVRRGYASRVPHYRRWPRGGEINFSDDELACLSFATLLKYETSCELRETYLDSLRHTWSQVRETWNPLWSYVFAACGGGPMTEEIREESRRTLERIPLDLVDWDVRNSHRIDVTLADVPDRSDRPQLLDVLAPDERPVSRWNGNPYRPDDGRAGRFEDDGAFFLLPYWMGRHHGWVD